MNPMWMEWSVPLQKLEVSKIQPGMLQKSAKPLTPLCYVDGQFTLQYLNVLLPPLPVKEYDAVTGKLILSLNESPQAQAKLMALQESFLSAVYSNQRLWFSESTRSKEQLQTLFQTFVEMNQLNLYCPIQTQEKKYSLYIWKENSWHKLISPGLLEKGDMIRVALRLQGISYQMNQSGTWTGRFRIQHRIFSIYHCGSRSGFASTSSNLLKNSDAHGHDA